MPFIVSQHRHPHKKECLSGNSDKNVKDHVALSLCKDTQSFKNMEALFHSTQMIHFYPHMREPQEIKVIDTSINPEMMCLTVQTDSFTINLLKCLGKKEKNTQLFTVNMIKTIDSVDNKKKHYVQFTWIDHAEGHTKSFCITSLDDKDRGITSKLGLEACQIIVNKVKGDGKAFVSRSSIIRPQSDRSVFRIERVNSTTYLRPKQ